MQTRQVRIYLPFRRRAAFDLDNILDVLGYVPFPSDRLGGLIANYKIGARLTGHTIDLRPIGYKVSVHALGQEDQIGRQVCLYEVAGFCNERSLCQRVCVEERMAVTNPKCKPLKSVL